jgi:hypothetical protein
MYIYCLGNSRRNAMTSIKKLTQFVGLGLAAMVLAACGGGGGGSSGGTGLMSLAVTDAPIDEDATRVVVRFTHIELKPRDGDRVVICLDGEDAYVLETSEEQASCETAGVREIDLLALQGGKSAFLFEEIEVPAGDYDWIRFYLEPEPGASAPPLSNFLTSSYIEFKNGHTANLIIPGGLQAGLQLVSGFNVPEGGSVSYTVDFDLRNMIQATDEFGGGYYRMRRALRLVDNSNVGVITGIVDHELFPVDYACDGITDDENVLTCPGLFVAVYGDETSPLTTATVHYQPLEGSQNWEHRYTVGFLSEGSYDLALTLEVAEDVLDTLDSTEAPVSVVAGEVTVVDFE